MHGRCELGPKEIAMQSSPAGHVANWTSPTLLIHGDADEEVDFQEAVGCVRKETCFIMIGGADGPFLRIILETILPQRSGFLFPFYLQ